MTPGTPYTWQQLSAWANAPLGSNSRVCINHGSTQIYYSGWAISAINRTDECLLRLFPNTFTPTMAEAWRTANGECALRYPVLHYRWRPGARPTVSRSGQALILLQHSKLL